MWAPCCSLLPNHVEGKMRQFGRLPWPGRGSVRDTDMLACIDQACSPRQYRQASPSPFAEALYRLIPRPVRATKPGVVPPTPVIYWVAPARSILKRQTRQFMSTTTIRTTILCSTWTGPQLLVCNGPEPKFGGSKVGSGSGKLPRMSMIVP